MDHARGAILVLNAHTAAAAHDECNPHGCEIVAAAGLKKSPTSADAVDVSYLFVAPAWHRRGIATALLRECIQRAEASSATTLRLLTISVYEAALALYRAHNFVEWRPREQIGEYTAIYLERQLRGSR
jgi:GNAT superfamily N-acetyltransferase